MKINKLIEEREGKHGAFQENSTISMEMDSVLRSGKHYKELPNEAKLAFFMMIHKMGRAVNGDPFYKDHYRDILGYAQCMVDVLEKNPNVKDGKK